jgi:hypothetical protein
VAAKRAARQAYEYGRNTYCFGLALQRVKYLSDT